MQTEGQTRVDKQQQTDEPDSLTGDTHSGLCHLEYVVDGSCRHDLSDCGMHQLLPYTYSTSWKLTVTTSTLSQISPQTTLSIVLRSQPLKIDGDLGEYSLWEILVKMWLAKAKLIQMHVFLSLSCFCFEFICKCKQYYSKTLHPPRTKISKLLHKYGPLSLVPISHTHTYIHTHTQI